MFWHLQNAPITVEETKNVIKKIASNKLLGKDSFSAEYYKAFKDIIAHLTSAFTKVAASGSFPQEMLKAIVITLLNQGKTLLTLKSLDQFHF